MIGRVGGEVDSPHIELQIYEPSAGGPRVVDPVRLASRARWLSPARASRPFRATRSFRAGLRASVSSSRMPQSRFSCTARKGSASERWHSGRRRCSSAMATPPRAANAGRAGWRHDSNIRTSISTFRCRAPEGEASRRKLREKIEAQRQERLARIREDPRSVIDEDEGDRHLPRGGREHAGPGGAAAGDGLGGGVRHRRGGSDGAAASQPRGRQRISQTPRGAPRLRVHHPLHQPAGRVAADDSVPYRRACASAPIHRERRRRLPRAPWVCRRTRPSPSPDAPRDRSAGPCGSRDMAKRKPAPPPTDCWRPRCWVARRTAMPPRAPTRRRGARSILAPALEDLEDRLRDLLCHATGCHAPGTRRREDRAHRRAVPRSTRPASSPPLTAVEEGARERRSQPESPGHRIRHAGRHGPGAFRALIGEVTVLLEPRQGSRLYWRVEPGRPVLRSSVQEGFNRKAVGLGELTHIDASGQRSDGGRRLQIRDPKDRRWAEGCIVMEPATLEAIQAGRVEKGEAIGGGENRRDRGG